jgi:hypothetical protein
MEKIENKIKEMIKKIVLTIYGLISIFGPIIILKWALESESLILLFSGIVSIVSLINQFNLAIKVSELEELQLELYRLSKTKKIEKNFRESDVITMAVRKGEIIEFNNFHNITGKGWKEFKQSMKSLENSKLE